MTVFSGVPGLATNDIESAAFSILDTDFSILPSDPNLIGSAVEPTVVIEEVGIGSPKDYFTIELKAGSLYAFDIDDGLNDPDGPSLNTRIDLLDSNGVVLARSEDHSLPVFEGLGSFSEADAAELYYATEDQIVTLIAGSEFAAIPIPVGVDYEIKITKFESPYEIQFVEARPLSDDFASAQNFSRLVEDGNGFLAFFSTDDLKRTSFGDPTEFTPPSSIARQRELVTNELDLTGVDTVSFDLLAGAGLDNPIGGVPVRVFNTRIEQGIQLSYRLPGTTDFVDIVNGSFGAAEIVAGEFTSFQVILPDAAKTSGVQLRWQQVNNTSVSGHWAIDNINIDGTVIDFELTPIENPSKFEPSNFIIVPRQGIDQNDFITGGQAVPGASSAGAGVSIVEGLAVYDPTEATFDPTELTNGEDAVSFDIIAAVSGSSAEPDVIATDTISFDVNIDAPFANFRDGSISEDGPLTTTGTYTIEDRSDVGVPVEFVEGTFITETELADAQLVGSNSRIEVVSVIGPEGLLRDIDLLDPAFGFVDGTTITREDVVTAEIEQIVAVGD